MKIKAKYFIYLGAFIGLTIWGIFNFKNDEIIIENVKPSGEQIVQKIYVHIDGEVNNPGIKEVEKGTRIFELIEIAGGETENADISRLNLSSILKDEQKIIVPSKILEQSVSAENIVSKKTIKTAQNVVEAYLVNINVAGQSELETLDGIGPSMAQKIINYREENGYFNEIDEIKNVSGIGEAKFNKIKDYITV